MVNPMVYCQAAAGLHLLKGAHCTPVLLPLNCRPIRTMIAEGTSAVYSGRGEGFHGSYGLACERDVGFLEGRGYSFLLLFRGQDWRRLLVLRDRIQRGRLAQSRASCWTERP